MERPILAHLEHTFLNADAVQPDAAAPNLLRWEFISKNLNVPKHLYEPMDEDFAMLYENAEGNVLMAALDLASLRAAFFRRLVERHVGLRHPNQYEAVVSEYWWSRLSEKYTAQDEGSEVRHLWLQ